MLEHAMFYTIGEDMAPTYLVDNSVQCNSVEFNSDSEDGEKRRAESEAFRLVTCGRMLEGEKMVEGKDGGEV